jgi:hypothetical protein
MERSFRYISDWLDLPSQTASASVCRAWRAAIAPELLEKHFYNVRNIGYHALKLGYTDIFQWAILQGAPITEGMCILLIKLRRTDLIYWVDDLYDVPIIFDTHSAIVDDCGHYAIKRADLNILICLVNIGMKFTINHLRLAARKGRMEVFHWLRNPANGDLDNSIYLSDKKFNKGTALLPLLQLQVHYQIIEPSTWTSKCLSEADHKVLDYLSLLATCDQYAGTFTHNFFCKFAARSGNLEFFKKHQRQSIDIHTYVEAGKCSNMKKAQAIILYLIGNNVPKPLSIISEILYTTQKRRPIKEQIQMCKWLHQQGFPWGNYLTKNTFLHMKLFKWAYKLGARLPKKYYHVKASPQILLKIASFFKKLPKTERPDLEFLLIYTPRRLTLEQFQTLFTMAPYPSNQMIIHCYLNAAQYGRLDIIQWLHESGHPLNDIFITRAAAHNQLATLKYLIKIGCPMDPLICEKITSDHTSLTIMEYLFSQGAKFTSEIVRRATDFGDTMLLCACRTRFASAAPNMT